MKKEEKGRGREEKSVSEKGCLIIIINLDADSAIDTKTIKTVMGDDRRPSVA